MQKYIAVVNPRMDDDEISHLIGKGIAGAIFEISHNNYPLAAKMIKQVKDMSGKHNRPVSIIQDTSEMKDPLDLEFGHKSGIDWFATDKPEHIKRVKGLDKLASVIFKGRNLPKGERVDSVMAEGFLDPDAQILGTNQAIKHIVSEHPKQTLLDSIIDLGSHSGVTAIAVSDLDLAKALSWRRPDQKVIFTPKNRALVSKAAIYWGVHPVYANNDFMGNARNGGLIKKGDRLMDATDSKHVVIYTVHE